ncbi:MAG: right-handed parallel beta-helix repeat-containing protein [Candidatus Binatia bacterium]|nr:right-handed parallel beta-helix repeat-containing protein [Candidatus Binatia bacterium]
MALLLGTLFLFAAPPMLAATIQVPADYPTVQAGLNAAAPGDTVLVAGGVYYEKISFPASGAPGAPIVLRAATDPRGPNPAVLDGTGLPGQNVVLIASKSHVRIEGFVIRNNWSNLEASGIRVVGAGQGIEIVGNIIHEIRGTNAMGITVYGTESSPIEELRIEGNEIFDCDPRPSEALTLNGNVTDFIVRGNYVHDVNNIGIDLIGGETDIQPDPQLVARNGLVQGNRVERAREGGPAGNGFAACIYIDGGRDVVVERNVARGCDLGIEVGAENRGIVASGNIVRNNFISGNRLACIAFGGYAASVGRANGNLIRNNTCYGNNTAGSGFGELWIQYAEGNTVKNNIFAGTQSLLLASWAGNFNNLLNYNLWYAPGGSSAAEFVWNGTRYVGFAAYRSATAEDVTSLFADPFLQDPVNGDLHLTAGSPALNAGEFPFNPAAGETDIDGEPRLNAVRVDVGADEAASCGNGVVESAFGEECDDGNTSECDGCDTNCTLSTRCGNGVLCTANGEACDDGNNLAGDCCDPSCQFEPAGASCDDGKACTTGICDGQGACTSAALPATSCKRTVLPGRAQLVVHDAPNDARDRIVFRWTLGEQTLAAELGNPATGSTSYELCLYDAHTASLLLAARAPAAGHCKGKPCWKVLADGGYSYQDGERTPDGLELLLLRPGPDGKSRLISRGKGAFLNLPSLPFPSNYSVVAQVHNSAGTCWEATFTSPARRNTTNSFVDTGN